ISAVGFERFQGRLRKTAMNKGKRLFSIGSWRAGGPREPRSLGFPARPRVGPILLIVSMLLPGAPEAWADDAGSTSNRVLQMFGLGHSSADAAKPAPTLAECPEIVIDGGGADLRSPP